MRRACRGIHIDGSSGAELQIKLFLLDAFHLGRELINALGADDLLASALPRKRPSATAAQHVRDGPLPDSCAATKSGQYRDCGSGIQLIEQRLRFLQIEGVEAFGKPTVDRSEKIARLFPLALIAPEPRHAHCGT
jgi:hypothetical protein